MAFTENTIREVWKKAKIDMENDPNVWRKDQCSAWINFKDYGKRDSKYGWEIDHIKPVSRGGGDELSNLRPLHWKNNLKTSDGRLTCPIKSSGNKNIGI